jgi:hypothetical protein
VRVRRRLAVRFGLVVAAALAALGESRPPMAQTRSSCPMPVSRQIDSIRAFSKIASFLTKEPRCVNCHGGVNPFISHTGPDPEDETAPASTIAHGGGLIRRQRDRAPDGTLLIESECMECHNGMVPRRDGSKSVWMLAPNFLSFVNKDAATLCKQIKRATHTETEFLGHLKDDNGGNNFGGTAFKGDRGLDPEVYDIPLSPPSISHAALMRLGQDWVTAMGGSFQGDENCGCEVKLKGKFTYTDSGQLGPTQNVFMVTGDLVWANKQDESSRSTFGDGESTFFRPKSGEITVAVQFQNDAVGGSGTCSGDGRRTFSMERLTPGALRHMLLEIADDGRYRLTLVIPDNPDPFPRWEFQSVCAFPNVRTPQPQEVRYVSVVLGHQQGTVEEDRIAGRLAAPIRRGPRTITGEWTFEPADDH